MRERDVERYLVSEVKKSLGEIRKLRWVARRGAPDRLVWIPGWPFPRLAELKAPGEKLQAHQKREHKRLEKMGFICKKLDHPDDIDRFLK